MKKATGYVKDLQDWLKIRNYSKATISAYGCALRQFLDWRRAEGMGVQFAQEKARAYILHRIICLMAKKRAAPGQGVVRSMPLSSRAVGLRSPGRYRHMYCAIAMHPII